MKDPQQQLQALIRSRGDIVNFGNPNEAPGEEWIAKAERTLRRPLPDSYKWFLRTYGGGEVGSEEIYSIYGMDFATVNGGDIVFQHLKDVRNGMDDSRLVISRGDFAETYFFDTTRSSADGEYPIVLTIPTGACSDYATDFYEFLTKRIAVHSS